jgi:hypothetical protein
MDYKQLAIHIASAEDPYGEFAKEASALDDMHKTTLAREVNKQFFLSRLEGRDTDGHIDFDVLQPEITGTHDYKSASKMETEKTASLNEDTVLEKRAMIEDNMFVLASKDTLKISASGGSDATFRKVAEHIIDDEAEDKSFKEESRFKESKSRAVAVLNDMFGAEVENLTKIANDASELRSIIGSVVESGLGDIVSEMVAVSNDAQSTLLKVASVDLDEIRANQVNDSISLLLEMKEQKALIKEASSLQDLEKLAFIASLLGGVTRLGFNGAKLATKPIKWLGKGIGYGMRAAGGVAGSATGAVSGAAGGLFSKNPLSAIPGAAKGAIRGAKGGSSKMALGMTGLTGLGIGMQFGPAMEKYQQQTLRT